MKKKKIGGGNRKGIGGRPPKSQALKKSQGTYRKDRDKNPEVEFPILLIDTKSPPPILTNDYQKNLWSTYGAQLSQLKILTPTDLACFTSWCIQMGFYFEFIEKFSECQTVGGKGYDQKPSAWWKMSQDALKQANQIGARLGLSPTDRERIRATPPGKSKPAKVDPWGVI